MISFKHRVPAAPRTQSAGFSLIELMIAIVLGALVVAGLINVLIANRQAYHLQEANNYNQQNMRFALDSIGWSLRHAGFYGGVLPGSVLGTPTVTGITGSACDATFILNAAQPIFGADGDTDFPLAACVNNANYVAGSDVLVVRYADADALPWSAGTAPTLGAGEVYLEARSGAYGQLFSGAIVDQLPFTDGGGAPQAGSYIYPYHVEIYYLRPCSDPGAGGVCGPTSDGGNPIPTLMRMRLDSAGALVSEPVVEGVEQLQFEYGLRDATDPNKSPLPTNYESASAVTAANAWPNVMTVRIGYVLRAQQRDTALPHSFDSGSTDAADANYPLRLSSDCEYSISTTGAVVVSGPTSGSTCQGVFNATGTSVGTNPQQYARIQMTAVVQTRNTIRQI